MTEQAENIARSFPELLLSYQAATYFLFAAAAALVLTAIFMKRKGRLIFLYPVLLLAVIGFNPFILVVLFERIGRAEAKYPDILLIIPVALVLAGGIVSCAFAIGNKLIRSLVLILACGLIVVTGVPSFLHFFPLRLPVNFQIMEPETIKICDYITEHSDSDLSRVAFEDETLRGEAREYTAQIAVAELFGDADQALPDAGELKTRISELEPDYIVIRKDSSWGELLEEAGVSQVAYTDGEVIYAV